MKTKALVITSAFLMILVPLTTSAFDGERHGFMLGLGAGYGQGKISYNDSSVDGMGFCSDFKIGGGPSNKVLVYYTNRALWYSPGEYSDSVINGMSAAGVSYFLEPQAPSFFFSGALGLGVISDSDASDGESGLGFTFGIGFEMVRSFIVELTYMRSGLSTESTSDWSISNIAVTLSWLAY
jgi:hypothetical protein